MKNKFNAKNLYYCLGMFLCISILSISIGFSAMTTTLSIDGSAKFEPIGMIRITDLNIETSNNVEEIDSKYTLDSVSIKNDINSGGTVTYNIEVTNLGQTNKMIEDIEAEIFSNDNMEYEISGYEYGSIIKPKEKKYIKITLKNKNNGSSDTILNTKFKFKFVDYEQQQPDYQIIFDSNGGEGTMESINVNHDEVINLPKNNFTNGDLLFKNWNTKQDGSGISYSNKQEIQNINYKNETSITLYAQWIAKSYEYVSYDGDCIFYGKGTEAVGDCSRDNRGNFVDTGIAVFSNDNYQRNFILSFTLSAVDDSRFGSGKRDTFFSAMYEENDEIGGKYPGVLLRIENGKLVLHISNGQNTSSYATDVAFTKEEFVNKPFKLIRYNDGQRIKFYYILGDSKPVFFRDLTDLYATFDSTLVFGAMVKPDNVTTEREAVGTLSDITFEFTSKENVESILNIEEPPIIDPPPDVPTVTFVENGPCTFNGKSENISGCSNYAEDKFINTNINLFSEENYTKDFDVSFTIDSYDNNTQEDIQVTLMNAFKEVSPKGYGMLVRRANNRFELIIRDGKGTDKQIYLPITTSSIRIVRKNKNVCYSIDGGAFTFAINYDKFDSPFNVPLTFGGSIDKNGVPFRYIKGTLSNMNVTLGKIDDSIVCSK